MFEYTAKAVAFYSYISNIFQLPCSKPHSWKFKKLSSTIGDAPGHVLTVCFHTSLMFHFLVLGCTFYFVFYSTVFRNVWKYMFGNKYIWKLISGSFANYLSCFFVVSLFFGLCCALHKQFTPLNCLIPINFALQWQSSKSQLVCSGTTLVDQAPCRRQDHRVAQQLPLDSRLACFEFTQTAKPSPTPPTHLLYVCP